MNKIFRIIDRFNITGCGIIYLTKIPLYADVHIGDILLDLRGNRFKLKSFGMPDRPSGYEIMNEMPRGLLFEPLDGTEVSGNILVDDLPDISFIFCNHPLYQTHVDDDYESEYQAARINHSCALFSYEDMQEGKLSLYGAEITGLAIYRGWMMKPEMYKAFYEALAEKGIILINTPEEYDRYHTLPGWYSDFEKETIESVWTDTADIEDVINISKGRDGAFIVKDYVKSRKHEWYDACYINNICDEENVRKVVVNFISRQDDDLVGGIVLRRFEKLKQIGFHEKSGMPLSEEYRIFIYTGHVLGVNDYWNDNKNVNLSDDECDWIDTIASRVKSNFATVDLARKEDGELVIVEFGDGQVSGLQQLDAAVFYQMLDIYDVDNPYSIEDIKKVITSFISADIEPEVFLSIRGLESEYVIIGYPEHISFQRCGQDCSGEMEFNNLDELFEAELLDGICLTRNWNKVTNIWCQPDMEDIEIVIESY